MGQIIITQDGEDKNQIIRTIRNDDCEDSDSFVMVWYSLSFIIIANAAP